MKLKLAMFLIAGLVSFSSCNKSKNDLKIIERPTTQNVHVVGVDEVQQATSYTYIKVNENAKSYWIAVPKMEVDTKATYYFKDGLEMNNFVSKDLNRTFETVYFINKISLNPNDLSETAVSPQGTKSEAVKSDVKVEPAEGGITLAELFANKEKYENKIVTIRGKVVKYNPEIMGKNWAHIQDGTDFNGVFDLTVTTADVVTLDEISVFEGKITLNKDFGSGYSYEIIMEDAKKFTE